MMFLIFLVCLYINYKLGSEGFKYDSEGNYVYPNTGEVIVLGIFLVLGPAILGSILAVVFGYGSKA